MSEIYNERTSVGLFTYLGLFLTTLAILTYEIVLTRIFSVTMFYHYAFVAISIALFGMSVGAVIVYLFPSVFTKERAKYHLAWTSLAFGIFIVLSFLTHISIPFVPNFTFAGLYSIVLTYVVISIPFILSGINVGIALTKFPRRVSSLYAVDLIGAALGCIVILYLLGFVDAPSSILFISAIALFGSLSYSIGGKFKRIITVSAIFILILFSSGIINTVLAGQQRPFLKLQWVRTRLDGRHLYEKWNSFSRVTVDGDPDEKKKPFGWGFSSEMPEDTEVRELSMLIDNVAGTVITHFDGDTGKLDYLKYDVTNLAHYLVEDGDVLIIGTGGGRDILSSLVFGQKSILGVEINKNIIDVVNKRFGDFSGHLDRREEVRFVNEEAQSYIAGLDEKFDLIQSSLIDTFAAVSTGAFVLSENGIYTVETWEVLLNHLTEDGILTFSRWHFPEIPAETYRLTTLAVSSLKNIGVNNPEKNIIIVKSNRNEGPKILDVATVLVCKREFTTEEINRIESVSEKLKFEILYLPGREDINDTVINKIVTTDDLETLVKDFPVNIAPPTNDKPFFFNMLRMRDLFKTETWTMGHQGMNLTAVAILGVLLIIVIVLTVLFIFVPLFVKADRPEFPKISPLLTFFGAIGFGFILVEISQLQRLIIYLGHPSYSLSVVLFTLLLSSGIGSRLTSGISINDIKRSGVSRFVILIGLMLAYGLFTHHLISITTAGSIYVRILMSILILAPLGLFMGMAFPIGMKVASRISEKFTPWLWGVNGATSVCGSVLAVVIAINWGISTSFWCGTACYVVALGSFLIAVMKSEI